MIYLLAMTLLILLSYYLLFIRLGFRTFHQKVIMAVFFTCAQIIMTQLYLGLSGLLYFEILILVNGLLILVMIFIGKYVLKIQNIVSLKKELSLIGKGILNVLNPANVILLSLAGYVLVWMGVCAYFLPPRWSDDLVYHLPPIFEYIINHKVFLLPVEFQSHFAFPENAEFLFMWPVILSHNQQWVDFIQVIMAFLGVAVIYGLARCYDIRSKDALFVSLLFLFSPVVLNYIGVSYIDITVSVFFLIGIYCVVMFSQKGSAFYFYSTALAWGLLCGMKYNMVFFILVLAPFSFNGRWKRPLGQWILFVFIFLAVGGYWYFRNLWILHNPFYPINCYSGSMGVFDKENGSFNPMALLLHIPQNLLLMSQVKRGFGLVFWMVAFPAWIYICFRRFVWWIFVPLILGIAQLMAIPLVQQMVRDFHCRYSIFILAFGFLALGKVLTIFHKEDFFRKWFVVICIVCSVMSVLEAFKDRENNYRAKAAIRDYKEGRYLTEQFYGWKVSHVVYGLLDYLTENDLQGMSCYVVLPALKAKPIDYVPTWISPLYGTHLQNRVWNLQKDKTMPPDAVLFMRALHKLDSRFPAELKVNKGDYDLIFKDSYNLLFIRKDFLLKPGKEQRLQQIFDRVKL